jgi:hypothetical protein
VKYLATESGLVVIDAERPRVIVPELWIPRGESSVWDLPPMRDPYGDLPNAEAFGIAGAFGTTMMASGSSVTPMGIYGADCKQWCRSDLGVTIGTDPFGTGTTVQAITLSGAAAAPIEFYLEITLTGARGAATYKYGANGSAGAMIETGVLTSGVAHACIGLATGISINFPVGTYTLGDNYKGVVSQWSDQSGNSNHYAQASSAAAPFYELTSFNSRPTLHFSGTSTYMTCTSLILGSGNDQPFTVFLVGQALSIASSRVLFGMGSTTDNDPLFDLQVDSTGPAWGFSKRSDVGGVDVKTCSGGTANTNRHYFTIVNTGTTQLFYIDGAAVSLTFGGDLNVGTATMNRMSLGARVQAALTIPLACNVSEVWGINRAASTIELNASHSYFASTWSI